MPIDEYRTGRLQAKSDAWNKKFLNGEWRSISDGIAADFDLLVDLDFVAYTAKRCGRNA